MKPVLWLCSVVCMLAGCGPGEETAKTPDSALGIKTALEKLATNFAMISEAKTMLKEGDLILRTGTDFSSGHIKELSKQDKTYSHGGIVVVENGEPYVCHVIPDFNHVRDKVRKDKLDSFCNPVENMGFAVARYNIDPAETKKFLAYLDRQYEKQVPFDMRFDLTTDDSMYCSEMIKKGLIEATNNRIRIENARFYNRNKYKVVKQYLKLTEKEYIGRLFVPIDRLYLRPDCQVLKRYVFE